MIMKTLFVARQIFVISLNLYYYTKLFPDYKIQCDKKPAQKFNFDLISLYTLFEEIVKKTNYNQSHNESLSVAVF